MENNNTEHLIKDENLDPRRRDLAKRLIQGTLGLLASANVANAENIKGLVKAAVYRRVHDLGDKHVDLGLKEDSNASVGRLRRWVAQSANQVTAWMRKSK